MAFKHPRILIPDLHQEGEIIISGDKYIHLARSVRSRPGDIVKLFNGDGLFANCEIIEIDSEKIIARIVKCWEENNLPKVRLSLAFGYLPPEQLKQILAGGTQLGVQSFLPFFSEFNDLKFIEEKSEKILDRWNKIIIENSAVASRSHLPIISTPVSFDDLLTQSELFKTKFVFWEEGGECWRDNLPLGSGDVFAVIGPKGGLSQSEVDRLKQCNFKVLSFGDLVLKAETASLAACARIIGG